MSERLERIVEELEFQLAYQEQIFVRLGITAGDLDFISRQPSPMDALKEFLSTAKHERRE